MTHSTVPISVILALWLLCMGIQKRMQLVTTQASLVPHMHRAVL